MAVIQLIDITFILVTIKLGFIASSGIVSFNNGMIVWPKFMRNRVKLTTEFPGKCLYSHIGLYHSAFLFSSIFFFTNHSEYFQIYFLQYC